MNPTFISRGLYSLTVLQATLNLAQQGTPTCTFKQQAGACHTAAGSGIVHYSLAG